MRKLFRMVAVLLLLAGSSFSTAHAGWDPAEDEQVRVSVENFKKTNPWLMRFFDNAYGYAVFPDAYKGGVFVIGLARGSGYVYESGRLIGRSSVTQFNAGPQLGVQSFSEVVFFRDRDVFEKFKRGNFEFTAQAGVVVLTAGTATNTDYSNGVAVFILPKAGVMAELSIGGQKFSFEPNY